MLCNYCTGKPAWLEGKAAAVIDIEFYHIVSIFVSSLIKSS